MDGDTTPYQIKQLSPYYIAGEIEAFLDLFFDSVEPKMYSQMVSASGMDGCTETGLVSITQPPTPGYITKTLDGLH